MQYNPDLINPKKRRIGRPADDEKTGAFLQVVHYLEENDDEQITIGDLTELMQTFLSVKEKEAYRFTHMKMKLMEHFGENIIVTEINGKPNVVTLKCTADTVLQEFHAHQKQDPESKKLIF